MIWIWVIDLHYIYIQASVADISTLPILFHCGYNIDVCWFKVMRNISWVYFYFKFNSWEYRNISQNIINIWRVLFVKYMWCMEMEWGNWWYNHNESVNWIQQISNLMKKWWAPYLKLTLMGKYASKNDEAPQFAKDFVFKHLAILNESY